ncbi:uncharacterized protein LOC102476320 isoform X2 [Tupaia chinensis]|uniref:uncharacterized protein LOC102476320 isoform X2 n=1 Tax=Tupaia chinensis TaxID=246437 RepID=UPI000703DFB0|nr:uncharacterized protein LOC102476320 isoform X2 [Tupaia chinensis]
MFLVPHIATKMSAGALENGDGVVADALLEEIQCDEEDEPFQSSVEAEASGACIPGGPPQGSDGPGSDPKNRGKNWFPTSVLEFKSR